jgi:hypothetical protein
MAKYLIIYKVDGTRYSEQVKATSSENAEYKTRARYPNCLKFEILSIQPEPKKVSGKTFRVSTLKQFTCTFRIKNGFSSEIRQIALYALDEASAKEILQQTYPSIIVSTIRIVEAI